MGRELSVYMKPRNKSVNEYRNVMPCVLWQPSSDLVHYVKVFKPNREIEGGFKNADAEAKEYGVLEVDDNYGNETVYVYNKLTKEDIYEVIKFYTERKNHFEKEVQEMVKTNERYYSMASKADSPEVAEYFLSLVNEDFYDYEEEIEAAVSFMRRWEHLAYMLEDTMQDYMSSDGNTAFEFVYQEG